MISRQAFRLVSGVCLVVVILGVLLPMLITAGPSATIGWALALVALVAWFVLAIMRYRSSDR
ncbi:hypothetical protein ACFVUS_31335 [Nocardia sp. NPDC058058]|uniref:hypothetical protein n=1 Tax=Nocardia sp. NPDC058058 TaxID=3346317 RepID=UPI0036D93F7A